MALFGVALYLRLRDFADLPVHRDWAWFLRSAGAHALGEAPASNHAFLYTSVPVVAFGALLSIFGLTGAVVVWGAAAALAGPLTTAALWRTDGGPFAAAAATLAGAVLVVSPAEVAFGRGIESPYLATTLVAAGLPVLRAAASGRTWGFGVLVFCWSLAAGMHVGLSGLPAFAGLLALWHAARLRERAGWAAAWRVPAVAVAGGLPAVWIVLRHDLSRLLSDVLLLSHGAGEGYADHGGTSLTEQLAGFGLRPGAAGLVVALAVAGVALRRPWRSSDAALPLAVLLGAASVGSAPFVVGFLRTGYLSADHSAALLPLMFAALVAGTGRAAGGALLAWLVAAGSFYVGRPPPPETPEHHLRVALDTVRAAEAWVDLGSLEPYTYTARSLEGRIPSALSADVFGEIARTARPPVADRRPTCLLLVPERREALLGLPRIEQPELRKRFSVDLFHDPNCITLLTRMPEVCAAVPSGFFERSRPRLTNPKHGFAERPGSCVGPMGTDPPGILESGGHRPPPAP